MKSKKGISVNLMLVIFKSLDVGGMKQLQASSALSVMRRGHVVVRPEGVLPDLSIVKKTKKQGYVINYVIGFALSTMDV